MLPRYLCPLIVATAALALVPESVPAGEHQLTDMLPRARRVLIATAEDTVDLREAGHMTFSIDRALRGRGRKGETIVVGHDGSLATAQFEKGRQYLILLQPGLDNEAVWTYVGTSALPYQEGGVVVPPSEDAQAATVDLSILQGFVDRYPSSPDAKIAVRKSLNGRWAVVVSINDRDFPLWVLDMRQQEDMVSAEILATDPQFKSSQVNAISVSDDGLLNLQIVAESADGLKQNMFDFVGKLREGVVEGNCAVDDNVIRVAKLRATAAKTIAQTGGVKPSAGKEDFEKAAVAEDEFAAYEQFVERHPDYPLAIEAYLKMLESEAAAALGEQEIDELTKRFIANSARWGERMRSQALVDGAVAIAQKNQHPKLALRYLLEAESLLTDTAPQLWKMLVPFHLARMLQKTGNLEEASRRMSAFHQAHPFEPVAAYLAAQMLEARGELDKALRIYTELAILPKMKDLLEQSLAGSPDYESVDKKMLAMWKTQRAKVGDQNEYGQYLMEVYREAIHGFATGKIEPQPPKPGTQNRVVLLELFTNANAPFCVAADVALSGLTHVIPPSDLVVLRYHLHSTEPDAMAGPQCNKRLAYYGSNVLPTLCLDGKSVPSNGQIIQAQTTYKEIRSQVEPLLHESVDLQLKLAATMEADKLTISVEALRAAGFEDQMRLRMALVEEEIGEPAANGLMLHENLVRIMPGGAEGIAPQDGKLAFETVILIDDYRQQLNDELTAFEEYRSNTTGKEFKYPYRPIGPRKLKLAAFVQDDATKQVLQAGIVDVQLTDPAQKPAEEQQPAEGAQPAKEKE